jgi:hypothetical protein
LTRQGGVQPGCTVVQAHPRPAWGPATASWASGLQAAGRDAGAQRRERGAPGGDLVQQRVQRGGVVVARLQDGVVLELGQQRQRDLLAYVGHLQRPADQPQLLGCPGRRRRRRRRIRPDCCSTPRTDRPLPLAERAASAPWR